MSETRRSQQSEKETAAEASGRPVRSAHLRPHLIVIFAIVMIAIASTVSAESPIITLQADAQSWPVQEAGVDAPVQSGGFQVQAVGMPNTIQWDAQQTLPPRIEVGPAAARPIIRANSGPGRPVSVDMAASLANFNADADPDGWRAQVVLRDKSGNAVAMRGHATFELIPRVPLADHRQFTNADSASVKWTMPLEYDAQGVASFRLPLRESLKPIYGWSSAIAPSPLGAAGARGRNYGRYQSRASTGRSGNFGRSRTAVTLNWGDRLGMPSTGQMKVRVSVPTQGVFEAVSPVWLRPSTLVDSSWPFR